MAKHRTIERLPEYGVWQAMTRRCREPKGPSAKYYANRGIKVCDRWLGKHGFKNFLSDMGSRPGPVTEYSLDRIDSAGDYTPSNCRWVDWFTQENNRSNNNRVQYGGRELTVAEWCRELGIKPSTLWMRLYRYGWSVERSLNG